MGSISKMRMQLPTCSVIRSSFPMIRRNPEVWTSLNRLIARYALATINTGISFLRFVHATKLRSLVRDSFRALAFQRTRYQIADIDSRLLAIGSRTEKKYHVKASHIHTIQKSYPPTPKNHTRTPPHSRSVPQDPKNITLYYTHTPSFPPYDSPMPNARCTVFIRSSPSTPPHTPSPPHTSPTSPPTRSAQ